MLHTLSDLSLSPLTKAFEKFETFRHNDRTEQARLHQKERVLFKRMNLLRAFLENHEAIFERSRD